LSIIIIIIIIIMMPDSDPKDNYFAEARRDAQAIDRAYDREREEMEEEER